MKDFIITTTNNIEFGEIKQYIGIVSTNIVLGANVFSDIAASFTDFFGGTSSSYQNKLEFITNMSKIKLQNKAFGLGANAILGYRIDVDEISGGGKSMFMISAIGTAVYVEYKKNLDETKTQGRLSNEEIKNIIEQKSIVDKTLKGYMIPPEKRSLFDFNPVFEEEFINKLIEQAVAKVNEEDSDYISYNRWIFNYLRNINTKAQNLPMRILYDMYEDEIHNNQDLTSVISKCGFMSPTHALDLLDKGININDIITLISSDKDYYTKEDTDILESIISKINSLKPQCEFITHKSMFGKEKQKWICVCGKENDADTSNCLSCGCDVFGITHTSRTKLNSVIDKLVLIKKHLI